MQGRVLGALLIREVITRYGRHNIGFLWLFVEPMLFTLGVTALWTATKSLHGSDLPHALVLDAVDDAHAPTTEDFLYSVASVDKPTQPVVALR